jgi:undecaprenyl-diphosphatase
MLDYLIKMDRSLFLFLNGIHAAWLDTVMFWISKALVWIPFYLLLLWLVIRKYGKGTLWILLFIALMITAGDQLANLFKDGVQRLRPSQDGTLCCVHLVNGYKGGTYGFYSAHASNTFALAVFLIMVLRKHYRNIAAVMIPWAFILSYSRIYLGVHYPGDMLAGMVVGVLLGTGFGYGFLLIYKRLVPKGRNDEGSG